MKLEKEPNTTQAGFVTDSPSVKKAPIITVVGLFILLLIGYGRQIWFGPENPPKTQTDLREKFQGPDGFKDIKFGMQVEETKRILGGENVESKQCEGRRKIECDQMLEIWSGSYFSLPDLKGYHAQLLFYDEIGLYRIVIDYYAASTGMGGNIHEVLKVRYGNESSAKIDRIVWDFEGSVLNLLKDQLSTLANIPTDEVQIASKRGLEILEARKTERLKRAAELLPK